MTHRIRPGGPNGANRPFIPLPADDPQDQMAQALDHIAVVLSSIDSHMAKLSSTAITKQTTNSAHISDHSP
jgi:hypothetical protein